MEAALPALPPRPPLTAHESAALDDAGALDGCTRGARRPSGARAAESNFAVQGMYCAACAGLVEGSAAAGARASPTPR